MNLNLIEFYNKFSTEQACLDYLEHARWGNTPKCTHCDSEKVYKFKSGKLWKCGTCRKQFTVKIGTIFSDSKIPLQKWFLAIFLASSLKKGISSIQLSKALGITQKTAWFMLHRLRAIFENDTKEILTGDVEVDETYVGGKGYNKFKKAHFNLVPKQIVMGMLQRDGKLRLAHVENTGKMELLGQIEKNVIKGSHIYSDENGSYHSLSKLGYEHTVINHRVTYGYGKKHTNSIEGVWSHLKRGINGIQHWVSKKHLQRYCYEYMFKFNTREMTDTDRFAFLMQICNTRLTYLGLTKS